MLPFKIESIKPFDEISLEEFQAGQVLLVDKPLEWTSFQAVNKLKYYIKKKFNIKKIKIGHAGTLDPLASGLLIVCTGKMTKSITEYQGMAKVYTGTIQVGATTPSFDLETAINEQHPTDHITPEILEEARQKFLGDIKQYPPIFSAVKVDGKRAYKSARKGEDVEVKARQISIYDFKINTDEFPSVHFEVKCSKGTYIRSLANDFGKVLQSGAHLTALRREQIGEFKVPA